MPMLVMLVYFGERFMRSFAFLVYMFCRDFCYTGAPFILANCRTALCITLHAPRSPLFFSLSGVRCIAAPQQAIFAPRPGAVQARSRQIDQPSPERRRSGI